MVENKISGRNGSKITSYDEMDRKRCLGAKWVENDVPQKMDRN